MPDLLRQTRFLKPRTLVETSAHALFRATDARSGRTVILKSAAPRIGTTVPEAKALRALRGQGVVGLVAVLGRPPHTLALEHIVGPTLEAKVRLARISEADLETLAIALFEMLKRIWSAGWVHGDIKPSNIVLQRGDFRRPVLVDLECAARIGEPSSSRLSAPFAAPERIMGGARAQVASDVFSLGATLYACARGASPFAGASSDATLVRVLTHDPAPLDDLSPRVALRISRMLAKDPTLRPTLWSSDLLPEAPSRASDDEQPLRAAYYAWRGAERAFEASDLKRAASLVTLADEACSRSFGPAQKLISALTSVTRARIARWTEDFDVALLATRRALASLPSGSASYCDALAERALIAGKRSDLAELQAVARALVDPPAEDAEVLWDRAASRTAVQLYYLGATRQADDLVRLFLERTILASGNVDERRRGLSPGALITHAQFHGRLDEYLQRLNASVSAFREIGDTRSECLYGSALGFAYSQLGRYRRAVSVLEAVRRKAVIADIPSLVAAVDHNLGEALGHLPSRVDEAIRVETRAIESLRRDGDVRLLAGSLAYRSGMHLARTDLDSAERDAREALAIGGSNASLSPLIFATLAFVELARQRHDAAEVAARRAVDSLTELGAVETGYALAHWALAEALRARGDSVGSRKSARRALRDVERRAAKIGDTLLRDSFLERVPEHRGLRRLSRVSG